METKYFSKKEIVRWGNSIVHIGFLKSGIEDKVDVIVKNIDNDVLVNTDIIQTENFLIFKAGVNNYTYQSRAENMSWFSRACLLGGVVFSNMSYRNYNVTATAKHIIEEHKVNENDFNREDFLCVHEGKLVHEKMQYLLAPEGFSGDNKYTVSTRLKNISVPVEDMEKTRLAEIKERVLDILK